MTGFDSLQLSFVLGGVGVLLLLLAGILRLTSKKEAARPAVDLLRNPPVAPGPVKAESRAVPAETGMTWEEREDVYKPTQVEAHAFVQTLGMPHPPEIQPKQVYIFVRKAIYDQIRTHLKREGKVEQGGLLFGQAYVDPALSSYLIVVEEALPAIGAQELPRSLTYTPEAWHRMTPLMQRLDPAWTLIGSYHSHPGMGVFLSGTDLNTQADVFAHDWQIALVIDPVADEAGFFAGISGEPCPEWYLLSSDRAVVNAAEKLAEPAQVPDVLLPRNQR